MKVRCDNCSVESDLDLDATKFVCPNCNKEGTYTVIFEFIGRPRLIMPLMPMKQARIANIIIDDPFFKKAREDFERLHPKKEDKYEPDDHNS